MSRRRRQRRLGSYSGAGGSADLFPWLVAAAGGLLIVFRGKISDAVVSAMRTPQDILDAVAAVDPEHAPDLQRGAPPAPKPTDTWCNKTAARITALLGVPIPFGTYGTLANAQIEWLAAGNNGWYEVADRDSAQNAAIRGEVVLATYTNKNGPGHIAIVLPLDGAMQIAQAGAVNFNRGALAKGFGNLPIRFFAHS